MGLNMSFYNDGYDLEKQYSIQYVDNAQSNPGNCFAFADGSAESSIYPVVFAFDSTKKQHTKRVPIPHTLCDP